MFCAMIPSSCRTLVHIVFYMQIYFRQGRVFHVAQNDRINQSVRFEAHDLEDLLQSEFLASIVRGV